MTFSSANSVALICHSLNSFDLSPPNTVMGTCCSNPEPGDGCPHDTCTDAHNKSTPTFEQSPAYVHSKTVVAGKTTESKTHQTKVHSFQKNHKQHHHSHTGPASSRLPCTERPSLLKLAKGPQPKVKIDEEKIKRSIYRKMRLCSEVALIGTGGSKTGAAAPVVKAGGKSCIAKKGKVLKNAEPLKSSSSHKRSTTKICPNSSICSVDSDASTKSVGFSVRSSSSTFSKKNSHIEDEVWCQVVWWLGHKWAWLSL